MLPVAPAISTALPSTEGHRFKQRARGDGPFSRTTSRAVVPQRGSPTAWLRDASVLDARSLVERGAQSSGKLERIVIGLEVHEDQARLLVQHVAVDRRDLDAVRPQGLDHRVDSEQNRR
jgi:hypothetical protein